MMRKCKVGKAENADFAFGPVAKTLEFALLASIREANKLSVRVDPSTT